MSSNCESIKAETIEQSGNAIRDEAKKEKHGNTKNTKRGIRGECKRRKVSGLVYFRVLASLDLVKEGYDDVL